MASGPRAATRLICGRVKMPAGGMRLGYGFRRSEISRARDTSNTDAVKLTSNVRESGFGFQKHFQFRRSGG